MQMPKVAAVQDLSGYGRCSLAVVMPILSCMGIQVCAVPTAVLSTHMGGFGKPTVSDLTPILDDYMAHWRQLELEFDCVYSGYLANPEQVQQVMTLVSGGAELPKPFVVIDPVMGDQGKLYSSYTGEMIQCMKALVAKADLITPNWTEVCFLLGETYSEGAHSTQEIQDYLRRLSEMGPSQVVITGVLGEDGCKRNAAYDAVTAQYWEVAYEEVPVHYPGTGDVFASVLVGSLLGGDDLPLAISRATEFVKIGVELTYSYGTDTREGIMFEKVLPHLFK